MIIGTVREIKRHEYRVGLTPSCVAEYVGHRHTVLVQTGAGSGAGFTDEAYAAAGAELIPDAEEVFRRSDMLVKVKEPLPEEYNRFHEGQILYTYLHLAAGGELARILMETGISAIAYETMETPDGHLPCLQPMSEIAGRLAIQEGAKYLEKAFGGRGVLLGGVPGVERGKVAIIGGGVVGLNACKIAVGFGAHVTILDINAQRLAYLDDIFGGRISTLYSTPANIDTVIRDCDLLVGAVLLPGARAPRLVSRKQLSSMKNGAVIVDVAIDQGGCIETSKPTTHDEPTYVIDGVVHYCVANMPGAVALTSTRALTSATLYYGLQLADEGVQKACSTNTVLSAGLNIYGGKCVCPQVAQALELTYTPKNEVL